MRYHSHTDRRRGGFTLVELMVSAGLIGIVGGLIYLFLSAGMTLFGKNVIANVSSQSARVALARLERDLHVAVAAPQLINTSLTSVSSGSSAGVALRYYGAGPCVVAADAISSATVIQVTKAAGFTPAAGDLLSLPAFGIERSISSVDATGPNWALTLSSSLGTAISGTATSNFVAFITRRAGYVVVGTELWYYPNLSDPSKHSVVVSGVTSPTPFSIPLSGGLPDRYVSLALTFTESRYSARAWKATNANMKSTLAYRVPTVLTTQ